MMMMLLRLIRINCGTTLNGRGSLLRARLEMIFISSRKTGDVMRYSSTSSREIIRARNKRLDQQVSMTQLRWLSILEIWNSSQPGHRRHIPFQIALCCLRALRCSTEANTRPPSATIPPRSDPSNHLFSLVIVIRQPSGQINLKQENSDNSSTVSRQHFRRCNRANRQREIFPQAMMNDVKKL